MITNNKRKIRQPCSLSKMFLAVITWCIYFTGYPTATHALSVVVINQGPETLALCSAKRCATAGNSVSFISSAEDTTQKRQRRLMYGFNSDQEERYRPQSDDRVKLVSSGDEIADVLEPADAFIIAAHEKPVDTETLKVAFSYTSSSLKRVVLISRQDASGGGGGFFGGGGVSYQKAEEELRSLLKTYGCSLAILRCGVLKGGGPGNSNLGGRLEDCENEPELGLSSVFYSSNFDVASSMSTINHDRFTIGANIMKGDPNKMPNAFMTAAMKDSTDASPTETNICTAALVASSLIEMCDGKSELPDLEISLGCGKSEDFPTSEGIIQQIKQLV